MLKEIKERHENGEVYCLGGLQAHQDRAYLLGLVEETAMFLKGIKEDLEHMCIKDTCMVEEEIGAFLSKLESDCPDYVVFDELIQHPTQLEPKVVVPRKTVILERRRKND